MKRREPHFFKECTTVVLIENPTVLTVARKDLQPPEETTVIFRSFHLKLKKNFKPLRRKSFSSRIVGHTVLNMLKIQPTLLLHSKRDLQEDSHMMVKAFFDLKEFATNLILWEV
ncbi:hypothetical protein CEXT_490381 [Caerostris extrusa]|uniref:Uncharacterized protein n=1 Tax=Caerostris extrusa TaxID=172846 RepID=A0AAV4RDZ9_CAEEX|nr:hypothetical protein CEXT_490381 [Caerostris extrusa]